MATDWKDILSSLRDENEPAHTEPANVNEPEDSLQSSQTQPLMVVTDKKGRNGKTATIIEGFTIPQTEVDKISKDLKKLLGVGGSTREGEILVQGDHKEKVMTFLKKMNFKVKG